MAATRQASAAAVALVARLVQANHIEANDWLDLRTATAQVAIDGPRFGATKPALINVCELLTGFTAHLEVQTKAALAAAMTQFIDEQIQQQPQVGQQLPEQQHEGAGPAVGSAEWRQALIKDLVAAQNVQRVEAPVAIQVPQVMSDTDSDTVGFQSYYVDWLEMTFVGAEEDLVPLLEGELARINTAVFLQAFNDDAAARASCRRELPAMLKRPDRKVPEKTWSGKKLVKLWSRALGRAILEMKPVISKRARDRQRVKPRAAAVTTPLAVVELKPDPKMPEHRQPQRFYEEYRHGQFVHVLSKYEQHLESTDSPIMCPDLCQWASTDVAPTSIPFDTITSRFYARSESAHLDKRMALLQQDLQKLLMLRKQRSTPEARKDRDTDGAALAAQARREHAQRMSAYAMSYAKDCALAAKLFVECKLVYEGRASWAAYHAKMKGDVSLEVSLMASPGAPLALHRAALADAEAVAIPQGDRPVQAPAASRGNSTRGKGRGRGRGRGRNGRRMNPNGNRCNSCNSRYHYADRCPQQRVSPSRNGGGRQRSRSPRRERRRQSSPSRERERHRRDRVHSRPDDRRGYEQRSRDTGRRGAGRHDESRNGRGRGRGRGRG